MSKMTLGIAPGRFPMVSHAFQMLRQPLDFIASLRGSGDIVKIRFGREWAYVVRNPELVRQVLVVDPDHFDKGGVFFEKLAALTGNGLATCPHAAHKRQRRLMQPLFSRERMMAYAPIMRDHVTKTANTWRPGQIIDIEEEMMALAVAILTNTIFSSEARSEKLVELPHAMRIVLGGLFYRIVVPLDFLYKLPTPSNQRFDQALARSRIIVEELVEDYRRAGIDRGDLLSALLAIRDEETGEGLSNGELVDQVITFFLGGTETSSSTLSFTFHVLAQYPEIERRLHAEVDEVLAGRPAGFEDLGRLDYTRRVIMETLRLYPPAWVTFRRTSAEVELGGHRLAPNSMILLSQYSLHSDADNFEDPKRFDPDRWLPDRAKAIPRGAMIPFGAGKRMCIGEAFGLNEITISLSTLAGRFRLRPILGGGIRKLPGLTLHTGPLPMRVESRPRKG